MDKRDSKLRMEEGGPEKLSNYTFRGYHLGWCINCCQKNDTENQILICKLKCEVSLSKRHILPSRRKRTSDSWQALPRYSWSSQMAPCHLTGRNKERQLQVRWNDKRFIMKGGLITTVSLIILPLSKSNQYLKATKKTISWDVPCFQDGQNLPSGNKSK